MKAYKLTQALKQFHNTIEEGRLLYMVDNQTLVIATPTKGQEFISNYQYENAIKNGIAKEIDLLEEKWIHPHLYKPIKEQVNHLLQQ